jgi:excinuclease UvrABC ATPase subunit
MPSAVTINYNEIYEALTKDTVEKYKKKVIETEKPFLASKSADYESLRSSQKAFRNAKTPEEKLKHKRDIEAISDELNLAWQEELKAVNESVEAEIEIAKEKIKIESEKAAGDAVILAPGVAPFAPSITKQIKTALGI